MLSPCLDVDDDDDDVYIYIYICVCVCKNVRCSIRRKNWGFQKGLCWKFNLICFHSMRVCRSTKEIFSLLSYICREQNKGLYVAFVDLVKAFNTVNRKRIWMIMLRPGCPPSSSAWLSNYKKTSVAMLGWTVTSQDPSSSSTAWNRVVFGYRLCSASFSTWCLNRS